MEILTSVGRLYISFKYLVNDFVYSFGRAARLLLVEVWNHTVPVRERGRIRVNTTSPAEKIQLHIEPKVGYSPDSVRTTWRRDIFVNHAEIRTADRPVRDVVAIATPLILLCEPGTLRTIFAMHTIILMVFVEHNQRFAMT